MLAVKRRIERQQGDNYPNGALDHLGIEAELANRVAMGRGLRPPRFRRVPFDDPLLFPLKNDRLAAAATDQKFFFGREDWLLRRYLAALGKTALPATLDEYLSQVVIPTLELQKREGAVAFKFEAAYLRELDFDPARSPLARGPGKLSRTQALGPIPQAVAAAAPAAIFCS